MNNSGKLNGPCITVEQTKVMKVERDRVVMALIDPIALNLIWPIYLTINGRAYRRGYQLGITADNRYIGGHLVCGIREYELMREDEDSIRCIENAPEHSIIRIQGEYA